MIIKQLDLNEKEALEYIVGKLRIKPIEMDSNSFYVRKYSTLDRIKSLIRKSNLVAIHSNKYLKINDAGMYYWIDIFVNDGMITIRCNKKGNL